jgi:hypothetical protein
VSDYADFGNLKETIFLPGEVGGFDQSLWSSNDSSVVWSKPGASSDNFHIFEKFARGPVINVGITNFIDFC